MPPLRSRHPYETLLTYGSSEFSSNGVKKYIQYSKLINLPNPSPAPTTEQCEKDAMLGT